MIATHTSTIAKNYVGLRNDLWAPSSLTSVIRSRNRNRNRKAASNRNRKASTKKKRIKKEQESHFEQEVEPRRNLGRGWLQCLSFSSLLHCDLPCFFPSDKKPLQTAEEKAGESVFPIPELQQIVMLIAGKDGKLMPII